MVWDNNKHTTLNLLSSKDKRASYKRYLCSTALYYITNRPKLAKTTGHEIIRRKALQRRFIEQQKTPCAPIVTEVYRTISCSQWRTDAMSRVEPFDVSRNLDNVRPCFNTCRTATKLQVTPLAFRSDKYLTTTSKGHKSASSSKFNRATVGIGCSLFRYLGFLGFF